jgi:iron complex outermembrane receptor protein
LFGSSTLGGLVNYIVNTADTTKYDAAAEGLIGGTKNSNGNPNYAGKFMINVPIIKDELAVRFTAGQRYDAGYLDNPGTGKQGSNNFRTRDLRGSVVFTPTADTKITYLAAYQDTNLQDQTYVNLQDLYNRDTPRAEPQQTSFFLNSLRLDQTTALGIFTVLGSNDEKRNTTVFTYPYDYVTGDTTGAAAAYDRGVARANIKTIEARFASNQEGPFHWLIGTSYLHATKESVDHIYQQGAEAFIDANEDEFGNVPGSVLAPGDSIYGYTSDTSNDDFGVFGRSNSSRSPSAVAIMIPRTPARSSTPPDRLARAASPSPPAPSARSRRPTALPRR